MQPNNVLFVTLNGESASQVIETLRRADVGVRAVASLSEAEERLQRSLDLLHATARSEFETYALITANVSLLLGERLNRRKIVGVLLAFAGVVALVFDSHILAEVPAVLVMASAAMVWGGATLVQRKLTGVSVMNGQAWNGLMGAAVLAPFALIFERPAIAGLAHVGWVPTGWFAFSCLGTTVLGQGTLAWLLQRYPISTIMPLMLASPVMSTVFASLYFGTPITVGMIAGGTVALLGVTIIAFSPDRRPVD